MWRWAAVLAFAAAPAIACDYPGPPPSSGEARAETGDIRWAGFSDATTRYRHGVLGDAVEAGGLRVQADLKGPCDLAVILPEHSVFEDITPRIADLDDDGRNEVIVVETRDSLGAALTVYGLHDGELKKIAATPNIGRTNRWLAPVGIADLDGDGVTEIAYVDRPHLAKLLKVWEWHDGALHLEAQMEGVTNHRIGENFISGGIRDCGQGPQMVVLSPDWSDIRAVTWDGATFRMGSLGPNRGRSSVEAALACR